MFGAVRRTGANEDDEKEEIDDKKRRQYMSIMQYLMDHELLETLASFEAETGVAYNEHVLKVSSVLETSLDMFADYTGGQGKKEGAEDTNDEQIMEVDAGVCCTSQSPTGPTDLYSGNVISVTWAAANSQDFTALAATADRCIHVIGADGETLAQFKALKSPALHLHAAPVPSGSEMESQSQEVLATTMGGEVLLLRLTRPSSAGYPTIATLPVGA